MAQAFLAQQLQHQQTEQRRIRRNHLGPWIARLTHQRIESHLGQQRNKQEDTCRSRSDTQWFLAGEDQFLSISDCGDRVFVLAYDGTASLDGLKKGDSVDFRSASKDCRNSYIN